jgi:hypothetical protein
LLQASRGKFNQIADELENLQMDPEYMYNHVLTMKADINWEETVPASLKWAYISETLLRDRVMSLIVWQGIIDECQSFQAVCRAHEESHACAFQPGSYMSTEVGHAFQRLCTTLSYRQIIQVLELGCAISDMGAMKHDNKKSVVNGKLRNVVRTEEIRALETPSGRIALALRMLQNSMLGSWLYGPKAWLDLLAEELSAVQSSQRTDDQLSSILLIDSMRMSISWGFQAVFRSAKHETRANEMPSQANMNSDARSIRTLSKDVVASYLKAEAADRLQNVVRSYPPAPDSAGKRLGPLLREFCDDPWPKSGSGPVWLEKATKSRHLLSAFWRAMRDEVSARNNNASLKPSSDIILNVMSFDTSPQYLAMLAEERELHQRGPTTAAPKDVESQTDVLQSTWGSQNADTESVRRKRTKANLARTRVEELAELDLPTSCSQQDDPMLQSPVSQELKGLKIPVKQESLSVFNKMFSSGGSTSIRWIQLVQALTDAGMTATQVPGSGVKFANDRDSIVFHKPHPEPVVDGVMLRCQIGRRLQKWFSWDKDTFVLRVKDAEEKEADVGNE